ncbi:YggS family pyridoxal phosphate-dependent enzyme [Prochlorococcus marinus]|uniref:YggS family pyridoxal phosphate-dependent enzyme n=1 Tax=Prochlorococcus marinus TaxID=1219 RepID=UPI0022B3E713|nr:YggS family pyridoxal phosphate-dependent enzyme [Prochlorococcus marinus]
MKANLDLKEFKQLLPSQVNLLAVSKGHEISQIKSLASQGQIDFGESRVQEALPKIESLKYLKDIKWHFIGNLQANKVRQVVRSFDVIHSVDSLKLAKRISRIAVEEVKKMTVMVQVKFREDTNKSGLLPDEIRAQWNQFLELPNVNIVGVMTISPIALQNIQRRTLFRECKTFAAELNLKECSMGMSGDWKEAVEEGATWIRLGSLLFGNSLRRQLSQDIKKSN